MTQELKRNEVLSFDDGLLTVKISGHGKADGWGQLAFHERQIEIDPDGFHVVEIPPSELAALRDFLNRVTPPAKNDTIELIAGLRAENDNYGSGSTGSRPVTLPISSNSNKAPIAMTTDDFIDLLTDGEGDTVTFCCKNPDFNGLPNECVTVNASWTDWQDRDFRADTREECLTAAVAAMLAVRGPRNQ